MRGKEEKGFPGILFNETFRRVWKKDSDWLFTFPFDHLIRSMRSID